MKLVSDWKECYKWLSVQIAAVLAVIPLAWTSIPEEVKSWLPENWRPYVLSIVAIGLIVGRLKEQGSKKDADS